MQGTACFADLQTASESWAGAGVACFCRPGSAEIGPATAQVDSD